ncbi:MAG TPA: methyltransferase domain-containing protein [Pyrinomonadaceae bacterium]|nr:methyltransferase domain-containing protein [Pyrinomonadaceae bacterium]
MFKNRSLELELIDTGDYTPEEYEGFLREIRLINRWLGDTAALKNTLLREIESEDIRQFSVLDVGAGSGELLRVAAKWARKQKKRASFFGLELNPRSARAILEESKNFSEISSIRGDALNLPFADESFDYTICSLFTHHFRDEAVVKILGEMSRVTRRRIFVIDLHRNPTAYFFYTRFATLVLKNRLVRQDGALSILRSFVPEELEKLAKQAGLKEVSVTKHFPSRLVLSGKT